MASEVFQDPTLGALFRYWDAQRRGRKMPARQDIDPIAMGPKLLPHLMLCEVTEHGNKIRFRLVGTSLVKRLGFDPTGQLLADLPTSDYVDFLGKLLRQAHAEAAPVYGESSFRWGLKGRLEARQLLLPLTSGGSDPKIVLVGAAYSSNEVFPPQIRALGTLAKHSIDKRETLPLLEPEAWNDLTPAKIA